MSKGWERNFAIFTRNCDTICSMMQSAVIRNPVLWEDIEPHLTDADKTFIVCVSRGMPCIFGDGKTVPQKPNNKNTIGAEVIRFLAYGGDESHPVLGTIIILQGAWIPVPLPLNLIGARIPYALGIFNCRIEVPILMANAECAGLFIRGSYLQKGLQADSAQIRGNCVLGDGFVAKGEVQLIGAYINGHLSCENGKFINPNARAICADSAKVDGNIYLRDGFSAEGEVRLTAARIGGALDCSNAKFSNPKGNAIHANNISVRNNILMMNTFVEGNVQFIDAQTNGRMDFSHTKIVASSGLALHADGIKAENGITLKNGFSAHGEVRLLNVRTNRDLDCTAGQFHNPDGKALGFDHAEVGGTIFLNNGFSAEGEVRMAGAHIKGRLDCSNGIFNNPGKYALIADGIKTGGDVLLSSIGDSYAMFLGEVRLPSVRVGGTMSCAFGIFDNPGGVAFNAEDAEFKDGLHWTPIEGRGTVNLNFAKTNVLADSAKSWEFFDTALNGFSYKNFNSPENAGFRLAWLAKRSPKVDFSPQPYEQAAKVLSEMGRPVDAWDILREKRRLEREHNKASWSQRVWGKVIDTLTDFVFRPLRTITWITLIVFAGAGFFGIADHNDRIVPHQPIVLANKEYQDARDKGMHPFDAARIAVPDYPGFNPIVFSLDVFIPLFNLHQEPYWAPDSGSDDIIRSLIRKGKFEGWWLLTAWYWIEIMAGWLFSSLLLLSVTGLLRPRLSSGEKD